MTIFYAYHTVTERPIPEMLVDGDIEVVEIVREIGKKG